MAGLKRNHQRHLAQHNATQYSRSKERQAMPSSDPGPSSSDPAMRFVVEPTSRWYTIIPDLQQPFGGHPFASGSQLNSLTKRAAVLFDADTDTYQSSSSSSSEAGFLTKMISSGTLSDRLSALTLLIQGSPLHNTKALDVLKSMAERGKGKGGREESLKALRCVVDWWIGGGAPDRKLKYFCDQPLLHPGVTDQHLLLWYFEDWLKKYFFSILEIAETLSLDPLPYVRTQSLAQISSLLREKPEQEQNLLRLLVNKLGDTDKALCSRASYHILQLLQAHPSMKAVVIRDVIGLIMRPSGNSATTTPQAGVNKHIRFSDNDRTPKPKPTVPPTKGNSHAKYYATITLNQVVLTQTDRDVALQLIDVYFEIFQEVIGAWRDENEKVEIENEEQELSRDKKGRIIARKSKKQQKAPRNDSGVFTEVEDSHSKLVSAILTGVNRALPFARIDPTTTKLNQHIDTLFFVTHTSTFNISLQALVLIQQISSSLTTNMSSTSKTIVDRYYRTLYDSLHDARLAVSSKQAMYLNLLFKSIKGDVGNLDNARVVALIRRFVQVLVSGGGGSTEFISGGLFLLGELFSTIPGLRKMVNEGPSTTADEGYDARKRDPQYAQASASPLWELVPLLHHYHPSISLHARQLLLSQPVTAQADLSLNTLSHFLDRFVYKNPKQSTGGNTGSGVKAKGGSAMQPAASSIDGIKLVKGEIAEARVNDSAFVKQKEQEIPVDQVFFHKFFTRKQERERFNAGAEEKPVDNDHDVDSDSDEEEDEIWKAMKATLPNAAEGDLSLDEDSDDIPDELEDEDGEEELSDEKSELSEGLSEDEFSMAEGSEDEDLLPFEGLIEYDGSDVSDDGIEQEWGGIEEADKQQKRKRQEEASSGTRKKAKSLPTFASYEDYAKLIEQGPEDDI